MWQLKFKIYDEGNKAREIIERIGIKLYYYPINYYVKNNKYFFIAVGLAEGKETSIKSFFRELKKLKKAKKERKIELLEIENRFFIMITSHSISEELKKYVNVFYNPKIIHIKPIIFNPDGEEWEVASIEKKELNKMIDVGKKYYELKLLKFYWQKVKNFGFFSIMPNLTEKQGKMLNLALDWGYYNYPRKISLDKLAKKSKLAFSTFHAHIRKAENKIISFVLNLKK